MVSISADLSALQEQVAELQRRSVSVIDGSEELLDLLSTVIYEDQMSHDIPYRTGFLKSSIEVTRQNGGLLVVATADYAPYQKYEYMVIEEYEMDLYQAIIAAWVAEEK